MSTGMGPSMSSIQPGMTVCGSDAEVVGTVREVRVDGIVVAPKKGTPAFVPRDAVAEVSESEHRVDLAVSSAAMQDAAWGETLA